MPASRAMRGRPCNGLISDVAMYADVVEASKAQAEDQSHEGEDVCDFHAQNQRLNAAGFPCFLDPCFHVLTGCGHNNSAFSFFKQKVLFLFCCKTETLHQNHCHRLTKQGGSA